MYKCKGCGRKFSEPASFVASCLTCLGDCDCGTDGEILTGCPYCGPMAEIEEINEGK